MIYPQPTAFYRKLNPYKVKQSSMHIDPEKGKESRKRAIVFCRNLNPEKVVDHLKTPAESIIKTIQKELLNIQVISKLSRKS